MQLEQVFPCLAINTHKSVMIWVMCLSPKVIECSKKKTAANMFVQTRYFDVWKIHLRIGKIMELSYFVILT